MALNAPDLTPGDFYPDYPAENGNFGPEHDPEALYESLRRATKRRKRSESAWRAAIIEAHGAGVSLRVIAEAAGVSHVRVLQITRGQ